MSGPVLSLDRVELLHGERRFIVRPMEWNISNDKCLLVITGPNGSGKTTLLNVLSGHVAPTRGVAYLYGDRISGQGIAHATRLGVVRGYQSSLFCEEITLWENLVLPLLRLSTLRVSLLREVAYEAAVEAGLSDQLDKHPYELSFGQKRMMEMLRLQVQLRSMPTRLVLLDEPLAGLDRSRRSDALAILLKILAASIPTVVVEHGLASHELEGISYSRGHLHLIGDSEAQLVISSRVSDSLA